jgi:uncharacterized protein
MNFSSIPNITIPPVSLIKKTENFVKNHMKDNDASHDWAHIERVRKMSIYIANQEQLPILSLILVELGALLHDIDDWKYKNEDKSNDLIEFPKDILPSQIVTVEQRAMEAEDRKDDTTEQEVKISNPDDDNQVDNNPDDDNQVDNNPTPLLAIEFLQKEGCKKEILEIIEKIITGVGYKEELSGNVEMFPELACVQDADRLDAIGAIGLARAFTFGGAHGRKIFDPTVLPVDCDKMTQEEYILRKDTPTINHFYEKLLKISSIMKTETGKTLAESRHEYMRQYLYRFHAEINGDI